MSPMVDGWKGDDWFHNGAFRQTNFDYIYGQTTARGEGKHIARGAYDDYELFLASGSAGDFARRFGIDQLPFLQKLIEHPAYDQFWSEQALDQILAREPLKVPTMYVTSLWDQEDMYGGVHTYLATEPKDTGNDRNFLVLGPWRHSGVNYDGTEPRAAQVRRQHRAAVPPRRHAAVPRPASEGRRAARRHPAGVRVRDRHQRVAAAERLAAVMCGRLSLAAATPVPAAGVRPGLQRPGRTAPPSTNTSPIRPSRCPTCRARCTSTSGRPGSAGWSRISARSPTAPTC